MFIGSFLLGKRSAPTLAGGAHWSEADRDMVRPYPTSGPSATLYTDNRDAMGTSNTQANDLTQTQYGLNLDIFGNTIHVLYLELSDEIENGPALYNEGQYALSSAAVAAAGHSGGGIPTMTLSAGPLTDCTNITPDHSGVTSIQYFTI